MRGRWSAAALTIAAAMAGGTSLAAAPRPTLVLQLDDSIQPGSLRYLERGLRDAARRNAALVVVELDTPGGTLVSLRDMTAAVTAASQPVAVYVTPAGARAASAGFFLLLASDYAAMAPGTNAGAAHPVALAQPGSDNQKRGAEADKAVSDAAALARSLATQRGRPVKLAEAAVTESRAFSAREALDARLIDAMPATREALLAQLDGRTLHRFDGRVAQVTVDPRAVEVLRPSMAERLLMTVADPQIAYLLLMLGAAALLIELLHPGLIVPGVIGGIALLLALYALSVLPVSFVGAALLVLAFAFFVAEAFVASFGLLAAGGIVCLVLGSLMLFDTGESGPRVNVALVLPVAAVIGLLATVLASRVLKSRRIPSRTGIEALVGIEGEVVAPLSPSGTVLVHGEYWNAVAPTPLSRGARVRVTGAAGRRLSVESLGAGSEKGPS